MAPLGVAAAVIAAALAPGRAAAPDDRPLAECAGEGQQCGGSDWRGTTCCEPGLACHPLHEHYHRCLRQDDELYPAFDASAVPPPPSSSALTSALPSGNPYAGRSWYVNPSYRAAVQASMNMTSGEARKTLEALADVPSAFWVDSKSKIRKGGKRADASTVEGILEDAAACTPPGVVTLIVYNLPNRDCFARTSTGEICCHRSQDSSSRCLMNADGANKGFYKEVAGAQCADGLKEYDQEYITPFAEVVSRFSSKVPIVLIIEPDSLPNLVTNMADSRPGAFRGCHQETKTAYTKGIKLAVEKLRAAGATVYVDAAHGGWLGWANPEDDKVEKFAKLIQDMQVTDKIRGFATNVANYQPLGTVLCPEPGLCRGGSSDHACCKDDPCGLQKSWNWGHNELNYIDVVDSRVRKAMPSFRPQFIVDTGRNGRPEGREDCAAWCNPRGSGLGNVPTTSTADQRIDAYFWLKTPGQSDGCTKQLPDGSQCATFNEDCANPASIGSKTSEPRAPEAGEWFHHQIVELVSNARLGDISALPEPCAGSAHGTGGANGTTGANGTGGVEDLGAASEALPRARFNAWLFAVALLALALWAPHDADLPAARA